MSSDTAQVLSMLYDWALPLLHIYPVPDLEVPCTFCCSNDETIPHLFFHSKISDKLWRDLKSNFLSSTNSDFSFNLKDVICYYRNPEDGALEYLINFIILYATFFIHKRQFAT